VVVDAGEYHTCALRQGDGSVWCWGYNGKGQLGDGTVESHESPAPVQGLSDVVGLSVYEWHACAVKSDGEVWCWGRNNYGQLGDGSRWSAVPVEAALPE